MKQVQLPNEKFLPEVCEYINAGHTATIRAKGNSMRPFIESERDNIVLGQFQSLHRGDVVLAEIAPRRYVLHRIDHINLNGKHVKGACSDPRAHIVLRGDGNVRGTEPCRYSHVRAIAVQIVRKGRVYNLATSPLWRTYSVLWPALRPLRRYLLALYRLLWLHELPERFAKK